MTTTNNKVWNIAVWVVQILLAALFLKIGITKLFMPETLPYPWVKELPALAVIAGIADLLGGMGLIFPDLLKIRPKLTVYAAYGIILLMICAIIFHVSRGESSEIGFNFIIIALAVFIAWGRSKKVAIAG
jgi:uncharacterized membrane protein YphA (DoxX/SURF4 family)